MQKFTSNSFADNTAAKQEGSVPTLNFTFAEPNANELKHMQRTWIFNTRLET